MTKKYSLIILFSALLFGCSKPKMEVQPIVEITDIIDTIDTIEPTVMVFILPVVVHIVHAGESVGMGYNISAERIFDQINTLNNDFRKKEGTLGHNVHELGVDTRIEFKLAEVDPDGNPTNGIRRVNFQDVTIDVQNSWFFDDLPYYGYWNKQEYINIWVMPLNGALGQSSVPYVDIPGLDHANPDGTTGVFISTGHFGTNNESLGRTLTHEMGHFLGLEHLWGKKENEDCMVYDDYCEDTPLVSRRTGNCANTNLANCYGEEPLTQNYMDYTSDACMNMFTQDQVARMRYVLQNSQVISPLINSCAIQRN